MIEGCGASILIRTASGSQPLRKSPTNIPPLSAPISLISRAGARESQKREAAHALGIARPRMRGALPLLGFFLDSACCDTTSRGALYWRFFYNFYREFYSNEMTTLIDIT